MTDEVRYLIILTDDALDYEVTKVLLPKNIHKYYTISEDKCWEVLLTLEELQSAIKEINDLGTYQIKRIISYLADSPPNKLSINNRMGEADGYLQVVSSGIWLAFCE